MDCEGHRELELEKSHFFAHTQTPGETLGRVLLWWMVLLIPVASSS